METLGQVAYEAMDAAWSMPAEESWQAVADAVIAAHESRRWRPIAEAPKEGYILAYSPERRMSFQVIWSGSLDDWQLLGMDEVATMEFTLWMPLTAPPQEVEHGK